MLQTKIGAWEDFSWPSGPFHTWSSGLSLTTLLKFSMVRIMISPIWRPPSKQSRLWSKCLLEFKNFLFNSISSSERSLGGRRGAQLVCRSCSVCSETALKISTCSFRWGPYTVYVSSVSADMTLLFQRPGRSNIQSWLRRRVPAQGCGQSQPAGLRVRDRDPRSHRAILRRVEVKDSFYKQHKYENM